MIIFAAIVISQKDIVFHEGNPIPILKVVYKLNLTNTDLVKLSDNPERYIIKFKRGNQPFVELMKNEGYVFSEEIGSGLVFEKSGNIVVATTKLYSKCYEIINGKRDVRKHLIESMPLKEELPKDFEMIFKYGFNPKNELDTFKGNYTKDMISDSCISVSLKLNNDQLKIIYNKMIEIGFFNYQSNFDEDINSCITPFQTYYFKVMVNGKVKEFTWRNEHLSQSIKAKKLRELIWVITIIIQDSPQYQLLPAPRGGYD